MEDLKPLFDLFTNFSWRSVGRIVDILLVAFLIYKVFTLVKGGRAWRIVGGVVAFVILLIASERFELTALHWILDKATILLPVCLVILFLPELRQALEGFGRLGLWTQKLVGAADEGADVHAQTLEAIVSASAEMAASRIGALMVLERGASLDEIVSNGVVMESRVAAPLLVAVFYEGNPLHDGALIIRGDKIMAAACRLPMSESLLLSPTMHMRHRAGVGVTEVFDCIAIIISEERGTIGVAIDGNYMVMQSQGELRDTLNHEWRGVGVAKGDRRERKALFGWRTR